MLAEFRLPFPVSVNQMFRNVPKRGRARTKIYDAWIEQAAWELAAQRIKPISRRVRVHLDLDETRNGDCDNRIKAVLDLLVKYGILAGDSKKYVQRSSAGWEPVTGCRVRIEAA